MLPPVLVVIYNIRLYNFPSDVSLAIIVEFYLVIGRDMKSSNQHGGSSMIMDIGSKPTFKRRPGTTGSQMAGNIDEVACCCGSKLRSSSSSRIFKRFISSFRTP